MDFNHQQWLGCPADDGAPYFRREFHLDNFRRARLGICGLGWHEVYLNGKKISAHVLDPTVTVYDQRFFYVVHEVAEYLQLGANTLGVILGNGWYSGLDQDVWGFDHASWRDRCKFALILEVDGREIFTGADAQWQTTAQGPLRFNSLRRGEIYDARREMPGWGENNFAAADWQTPIQLAPPGGRATRQNFPACQVTEILPPRTLARLSPTRQVADFGANISGRCRLTMRGEVGAVVEIRYGERLTPAGEVDKEHLGKFLRSGENQCDRYILRGAATETWAPQFTFHGFQYAQIDITGAATAEKITAEFIHSAFAEHGDFAGGGADFAALQLATRRSYRANFVGFPTDCPHREKLGWTGDAHLAAETGLCNFAAAPHLAQWLTTLIDCQRPNGQLPGIAPTAGFGYNWGSGPAWDAALFLIPELIYLYTGDLTPIRRSFPAMLRYLEYAATRADRDGVVDFGLGDWNHPDPARAAPSRLVVSAYLCRCYRLTAKFARRLTKRFPRRRDFARQTPQFFSERADQIAAALWRDYADADGGFAGDNPTALALALQFALAPPARRTALAERLNAALVANHYRADFGIIGASAAPRALAEAGYATTAFRVLTQPEFPGWVNWLRQGATSLWGNWDGGGSRNHIMFGDVSAWGFRYLGGLAPDERYPGFSRIILRPVAVAGVDNFSLWHQTPRGKIAISRRRLGDKIAFTVRAPRGVICEAAPREPELFQCEISSTEN